MELMSWVKFREVQLIIVILNYNDYIQVTQNKYNYSELLNADLFEHAHWANALSYISPCRNRSDRLLGQQACLLALPACLQHTSAQLLMGKKLYTATRIAHVQRLPAFLKAAARMPSMLCAWMQRGIPPKAVCRPTQGAPASLKIHF